MYSKLGLQALVNILAVTLFVILCRLEGIYNLDDVYRAPSIAREHVEVSNMNVKWQGIYATSNVGAAAEGC